MKCNILYSLTVSLHSPPLLPSSSLLLSFHFPIHRSLHSPSHSPLLPLTSLGSRCVPPAPGNSPNMTSGRPRIVLGVRVAIR